MALPWFRVDCHIGDHDKILSLLNDPSPKRWQASFSYICAIGWAVDHGTDGFVPKIALPFVHGTTATARLLVVHRLWEEGLTGWQIRNFADRQQLQVVSDAKSDARRVAAEKANCVRWHAKGCWGKDGCSRDA